MFRVPYRWTTSTIWPNIRSCWWDMKNGVYNLWRWLPLIWFDADFDWEYLAEIMEFKLRNMAEHETRYGHHVGSALDAERQRICAELLRRMREDAYHENAVRRFGNNTIAAEFAIKHQRADQKYLGILLGKHLASWWD
jgi:hypothetical protein